MKKDVHDLNPGELAIVAIDSNYFAFNALTKKPGNFGVCDTRTDYLVDGDAWKYTTAIPHASIVFVISKHRMHWFATLASTSEREMDVYKIIYQDGIYLIPSNILINPHFNESET